MGIDDTKVKNNKDANDKEHESINTDDTKNGNEDGGNNINHVQNEDVIEEDNHKEYDSNLDNTNSNNIKRDSKKNNENIIDDKYEKNTSKKGIIGNVLGAIWKCISIMIVAFVLIILIRILAFNRYDIFGYRVYLIMSGSMVSEINVKDIVITKEVDELNVGDIIAYKKDGVVTVHRIIDINTEGNKVLYKTKGDANNAVDPENVEKPQIKGKVVHIIKGIGDLVLFIQSHFIIIIGIIGIIVIVMLVRRLI